MIDIQTRRARAAILALLLGAMCAATVSAQTAVFVVRHAEKADLSTDAILSAEGAARAESLARHLRGAGVKAIYVTEYKRTALTAAPLADALGLPPVVVPARSASELVDRIRKDHPSDVVLVVGHSNTVPDILKRLGHPDVVEIADTEYDNLFVLVPRGAGPPAFLRLKF